jgi:uncharacterized protein (TIGR03437 family)
MDSARLEQAAQYVEWNSPTRFSLLVFRNGRLVFERYFHDSQATDSNNIKSVSKSVLSILTGIAIQEGLLRGTDQKLYEFYPEYFRAGDDPRKWDITLAHLMTMTAGFPTIETSTFSDPWWNSPDRNRFLIELPLESTPGEMFSYSTGLSYLISGILTKASGGGTLDFANSRLFGPLGVTCTRWDRDSMGIYYGGSQVWLTARDLAKIGLLVLRNGRWEDRTIVSEEWLRTSTRLRVRTPSIFGDYAYFWWKDTIGGYPATIGMGFGGQYMFLVPDLDLIMVTSANSDIRPAADSVYLQPYEIMGRFIIPAVQAGAPQINQGGVVNAADYSSRLAAGSFASAFGGNFSLVRTNWDYAMPADGRLPEGIGGVRVLLSGRAAHSSYVSGDQINFLVPPDLPPGRYRLDVVTPQGTAVQYVDVAALAPALFTFERDGIQLAAPEPVRAGDFVALWVSGLGPSEPAAVAGRVLDRPLSLANTPEVLVAGRPAEVVYAALAMAGVCQVNIRVPEGIPTGLAGVQLRTGGATTLREVMLEIAP